MKRPDLPLAKLSTSTLIASLHKIFGALLSGLVILGLLGSALLAAPPSTAALAAPASSESAASAGDFLIFSSEAIHSPKWFHWMSSRSLRLDSTASPQPAYRLRRRPPVLRQLDRQRLGKRKGGRRLWGG
jgi:hypothetical protein